MSKLVCVGQIVNVHGIKGVVKIKPYLSQSEDMDQLSPLTDGRGRMWNIKTVGQSGECILASLDGIKDRTMAETLKGIELFAERSKLPSKSDDEFYYVDLVGLNVMEKGGLFGVVSAVQNYGASDILEVKLTSGKTIAFPFTKAIFPVVDVVAGQMEIVVPDGMEGVVHED